MGARLSRLRLESNGMSPRSGTFACAMDFHPTFCAHCLNAFCGWKEDAAGGGSSYDLRATTTHPVAPSPHLLPAAMSNNNNVRAFLFTLKTHLGSFPRENLIFPDVILFFLF